jgi:hypothetical protein
MRETLPPRGTNGINAGSAPWSRALLFCLASGTDWQAAGIAHATAQHMMVRGLIERQATTRYVLTEQGRAVLTAFLDEQENP